jgi:hypothetical protein
MPFTGTPITEWIPNGKKPNRMMVLQADFSFKDANAKVWTARKHLQVDGASIPRPLWTVVGSPYTGPYRMASIVHDQMCVDHPLDGPERKAADLMFREACIEGGCTPDEAMRLYLGVRIGSSWSSFSRFGEIDTSEIMTDEPLWYATVRLTYSLAASLLRTAPDVARFGTSVANSIERVDSIIKMIAK